MRTQEFNSKLISLLPLDEVPVHVPLRRPRPLRFERLRVGGEGKADANLTNFLSTCCASSFDTRPRPSRSSPSRKVFPACSCIARVRLCWETCPRSCQFSFSHLRRNAWSLC